MIEKVLWLDEDSLILGTTNELPPLLRKRFDPGSYSTGQMPDFDRSKMPLHHYHLTVAKIFADSAKNLETEYSPDDLEDHSGGSSYHNVYVIYSIISSLTLLEANINTVYDEILGRLEYVGPPEIVAESGYPNDDDRFFRLVKRVEQINYVSSINASTLNKYQLILAYTDEDLFDPGSQPFQDVNTIRRMRNYFIHYIPEWYEIEDQGEDGNVEHPIGSAVQGKFDLNPFGRDHRPFFPFHILSADCARWALETCVEFADEWGRSSMVRVT